MDWFTNIQQQLTQQIRQQRLPHALLFAGSEGSGKAKLLTWLTQVVQCQQPTFNEEYLSACGVCKHCRLMQSNTFPDNTVIDEAGSSITVDSIRAATHFLETKPQIAQQKVVMISSVEHMTEAAANALLKTLEEPTQGNLLVLSTANIELLLPTIISRCQLVELRPQLINQSVLQANPYANSSYLPELENLTQQQAYIAFAQHCISFIKGTNNLATFERSLFESERALVWLERVICTLIRIKNGWQAPKDFECFHTEIVSTIDNDSLMRIFQLILVANRQIKEYAQVNTAMLKQRLVVDIAHIVAGKENEHG